LLWLSCEMGAKNVAELLTGVNFFLNFVTIGRPVYQLLLGICQVRIVVYSNYREKRILTTETYAKPDWD
jgi:hypothetical protein